MLLVISGFVGGIALPAVASSANTLQTGTATSYKDGQSVKVSASIETSKVSRDTVGATSEAELRTEQINAQILANAPGPRQPGDDYPWRDAGYSLSPLGYYYRQCVDFVAWRLNRDQGVTSAPWKWVWSNLTPNGGDASQWEKAWIAHGWTTSATPIVGSVAWFVGDHVAYVHAVDGDNVTIEEYNGDVEPRLRDPHDPDFLGRTVPVPTDLVEPVPPRGAEPTRAKPRRRPRILRECGLKVASCGVSEVARTNPSKKMRCSTRRTRSRCRTHSASGIRQ